MAVDKDLMFPGNKEYAPDKCCILPQTLNTMLSNCKKHRTGKWRNAKMDFCRLVLDMTAARKCIMG